MKAEFEFTIDSETGEPKIKFRHYDKSCDLEQKLLKVFIDRIKERGIELVNTSGYIEGGTSNSFENYELKIGK